MSRSIDSVIFILSLILAGNARAAVPAKAVKFRGMCGRLQREHPLPKELASAMCGLIGEIQAAAKEAGKSGEGKGIGSMSAGVPGPGGTQGLPPDLWEAVRAVRNSDEEDCLRRQCPDPPSNRNMDGWFSAVQPLWEKSGYSAEGRATAAELLYTSSKEWFNATFNGSPRRVLVGAGGIDYGVTNSTNPHAPGCFPFRLAPSDKVTPDCQMAYLSGTTKSAPKEIPFKRAP